MIQKGKSYKEPIFLFTSGSLRFAAWAGWYAALGDAEHSERWAHQARAEWVKEIGAERRFSFLDRYNHSMYDSIPPERFHDLVDQFLHAIKREIRKQKTSSENNT